MEQGIEVRFQGMYVVEVDCQACELHVCHGTLKPLIIERRVTLRECVQKRVEFAVVVSVVGGDDHAFVEKVCDSVEIMSNLADNLLEAGWC